MDNQDFSTTILVDQAPGDVFNAINNVRGWWSEEIEGQTASLNDVFYYHFQDIHKCTIKLVEVVPQQKVVWLVLDNYFKFTADATEWTGTKISFEIEGIGDKTQLRFTHYGLTPGYECFEICRDCWTTYIQNSLRDLIVTGQGQPNASEKPRIEHEKELAAAK